MSEPTDASTDEHSPEGLIGAVVDGKYRVESLLGEGGMGAVYKVCHTGLRRDFALKVLHSEITSHPEVAARFDREAWSAAKLDHPNCLQVTDVGTTDGGLKYMVMQLLNGHELADVLDGPLPPARAVELALQVVRGLEHAHDHGIIHRDIKPQNVFITVDHEGHELVKLVDFGIAKMIEGDGEESGSPKLTQVGMVFGTPRYMSPEQAAGGDIDHRTDLYSVGIILYEMLSGTVPFASEDLVKVLRQQIVMEPPPLPDHVPAGLRAVVERLLEKDRDDRYEDAAALAEALEQADLTGGAAADAPTVSESAPTVSKLGSDAASTFGSDPTLGLAAPVATPVPSAASKPRAASSLPTLAPMPAPRARPRPPLKVLGAGAGALLALVITCSLWGGDDDESGGPSTARSESALGGLFSSGPDADALQAIDDAIVGGRLDQAETELGTLEQEYPEHALLTWRHGRLHKARKDRKEALATYGAAAQQDPELLENPEFFAEVNALLHQPKLRKQAVKVAIESLGQSGHKFLLERLNDMESPLPWDERKRAAEAVRVNEQSAELLDARRQLAQDLLQASKSDSPCNTFGAVLLAIRVDLHEIFLQPVHDARLPRGCKEHKQRLQEVRAALVEKHGPAKKRKKKCRGLGGMFGGC